MKASPTMSTEQKAISEPDQISTHHLSKHYSRVPKGKERKKKHIFREYVGQPGRIESGSHKASSSRDR
jgi:hypothetical protein